jgi:hypothetical protein
MAVPERRLDEVAPEEPRAAYYQYFHLCSVEGKVMSYLPAPMTLSPGRLTTLSMTPYSRASSGPNM